LVCSKFGNDVEPLETLQKRTTELSVTIEKSTNKNNTLPKRDILAELLKRKVA